ncbi:hypothetical protein ACF068_31270 [Streptomyces sp. NPDC016309]|uniref:hypothetical protein n=1 Tax=Streptomyces sp. NPDC016309 TaxID=3364965 RepID=UPI0036FBBC23
MARTRGTLNTWTTWLAGAALVAVLALTGYVMLSGEESASDTPAKGGPSAGSSAASSPASTYAPPDEWTEPERWVALPRGQRTDEHGSEVGFPHTTEGAVAMIAASNETAMEGDKSAVDEQLRIYHSYLSKKDQSPQTAQQVELKAMQTDKDLARQTGVKPGQPLPPGAYVRSNVVGYQVIQQSADEVSVWVLTDVAQKTGETAKESGGYARLLAGARWEGGDWKLSGAATQRARQATRGESKPGMVAPGDGGFNREGWTAIREAS